MPPLITAISRENLEEVKRLLSEGADVHVANDNALELAVYNGNIEIVKLLVAHGANIHLNSVGWAEFNGDLELTEFLNNKLLLLKINDCI